MAQNMASWDRWIRALFVAPLAVFAGLSVGASTLGGIVLFVVATIMLATAAVGFCPLYRVLGISTGGADRRTA